MVLNDQMQQTALHSKQEVLARKGVDGCTPKPKPRITNFSVQSLLDLNVASPTDSGYCSSSPNPDDANSRSRNASTDSRRSLFERQEASASVDASSSSVAADSSKNLPFQNFWHAINSRFMPSNSDTRNAVGQEINTSPIQKNNDSPNSSDRSRASPTSVEHKMMSPLEALRRHTETFTKRSESKEAPRMTQMKKEDINFPAPSSTPESYSYAIRNPFYNILQNTHQPCGSMYSTPVMPPPSFCPSPFMQANLSCMPLSPSDIYWMQLGRLYWEQALRSAYGQEAIHCQNTANALPKNYVAEDSQSTAAESQDTVISGG